MNDIVVMSDVDTFVVAPNIFDELEDVRNRNKISILQVV